MEITKKKLAAITVTSVLITIIAWTAILYAFTPILNLQGKIGLGFQVDKPIEIHATVTFYKEDKLIFSQYHAGAVTNLGDNMTIYKLIGSSSYKYGSISYLANATFISIGNQGALSTSSTVLPGEWNRSVTIVPEVIGQSQFNLTTTFYPAAGPYTADCIGINFSGSASANDLWGYDTFTEVTGIDDTFTINVEFSVTVSHA